MNRSFMPDASVRACNDDSLAGERVGGNGGLHEELAVKKGRGLCKDL